MEALSNIPMVAIATDYGGLEMSLFLIKAAFIHNMKKAYGYYFKWNSVKAHCIKWCATLLGIF